VADKAKPQAIFEHLGERWFWKYLNPVERSLKLAWQSRKLASMDASSVIST